MSIETPKYKVIKSDGKFQLRKYSKRIVARVTVSSDDHNSAGNTGFGDLADFIFGNNTVKSKISMTVPVTSQELSSEKISMTAPVETVKKDKNLYSVTFTMPSKYDLSNLPKPNNTLVQISEVPSREEIVVRFPGRTSEKNISKKTNELKEWAKKCKVHIQGNPVVSRFDPPWKPGIFRHNELSFVIE